MKFEILNSKLTPVLKEQLNEWRIRRFIALPLLPFEANHSQSNLNRFEALSSNLEGL